MHDDATQIMIRSEVKITLFIPHILRQKINRMLAPSPKKKSNINSSYETTLHLFL